MLLLMTQHQNRATQYLQARMIAAVVSSVAELAHPEKLNRRELETAVPISR
jgi:hypothetical protein